MVLGVFVISLVSAIILVGLSILPILLKQFHFWPPSGKNTWQYRFFWLFFRIMLIGLIILCVLDFNGLTTPHILSYWFSIPLTTLGFSIAFYLTFYLGWKNAHGEPQELRTTGYYQWSRNPIYVASLIGMFGLGITINSFYVYILLALWAMMYLFAPLLEEPWLEKQYGKEFLDYKACVPRFMGRVKKRPNNKML